MRRSQRKWGSAVPPGTDGNYRALYQCTDSGLLARAMVDGDRARLCEQAFNITNGDLIRWRTPGRRLPVTSACQPVRAGKSALSITWRTKGPFGTDREEARATAVQLPGNRCVGLTATLSSRRTTTSFQISARRASGFHESVDTEEMFFRLWDEMRRAYYSGLIPAFDHFAPLLDLARSARQTALVSSR